MADTLESEKYISMKYLLFGKYINNHLIYVTLKEKVKGTETAVTEIIRNGDWLNGALQYVSLYFSIDLWNSKIFILLYKLCFSSEVDVEYTST